MLSPTPDPLRIAMNRVTFGARDTEVRNARVIGWPEWVGNQLGAPSGDDLDVDAHLKTQTMRILYNAPAAGDTRGKWVATDEIRRLNYANADLSVLWDVNARSGTVFSYTERARINQELAACTWIRNTHSRYQLREFMTDFWHNHFNIGKNENATATSLLPIYDRKAIRPHVLGNFRTMLEANATSASMLIYLDNWISNATTPNENYAREIMELHTLGGGAYYGTAAASTVPKGDNGVALGFTDQDIVQASRVLSGWTIQNSQRGDAGVNVPSTGEFIFIARLHNREAGNLLGVSMAASNSPISATSNTVIPGSLNNNNTSQGRKFLDILAAHPATATFIVTKLAKRIFGDSPPQAVIDRGIAAWRANQAAADQIAQVLRAILLDGTEIMTAPVTKVRRPYERIIAMARTTDMVVNAGTFMENYLNPVNDGLFTWPAPDGRPDANAYWMGTGATLASWNYLFALPNNEAFASRPLAAQSPLETLGSPTLIVEYWVGRMVGHQLSNAAMQSLVADQASNSGVPAAVKLNRATNIENAHRRLVSLIATTEEFSLR